MSEGLVASLVAEQFPAGVELPIVSVASTGTDNTLWRLGDDLDHATTSVEASLRRDCGVTTFVVTYTHPDEAGWQEHLGPHLEWLLSETEAGRLRLSGPLVGTAGRSALLVIEVADRAELDATIATDPFWIEGLVADVSVAEWEPIFGDLAPAYVEVIADPNSPAPGRAR